MSTGRAGLRQRVLARNPLPPGALLVGVGLLVSGVTSYAFLVICSRTLGPDRYSPLSALWALVFVAAPGLFLPLEQEVGRAIAARRVAGNGGRPVVRRAAALGAALVVVLLVVALAASRPIVNRLFDGQVLLFVGFAIAVVVYSAYFLGRGALAGNGRFRAYSTVIAIEGVVRVAATIALAVAGVRDAGVFSLAIGLPAFAAIVAVVAVERRGLAEPGPPAPAGELGTALGLLLASSLLGQLLLNIAPLAVKVVVTDDPGAAGRFLDAIIVARIPLFFFQAVQAALLPRLAAQAAALRWEEFRATLRSILLLVAAVVVVATLGMLVLGPTVVRILFGAGFALGRGDLALLAFGSELIMASLALSQGCIALAAYGRAAAGWAVGLMVVVAGLVLLPGAGVVRVEVSFCAGSIAAVLALGVALRHRLGSLSDVPTPTLASAPGV